MGNFGHRLGGDVLPHEGNTLQCLKSAKGLQVHKKFRYWEFDVHETKDGELVVFHDDYIPFDSGGIAVSELTAEQVIEGARDELEIEVPRLQEVLETLVDSKKPIRIEIKHLFSDEGRQKFIDMVADAKEENAWNCKAIAWTDRFRKAFPKEDRARWAKAFSDRDLALVRVGMHHVDLFKGHRSPVGRVMFSLGIGPLSRRR